VAEEVVRRVRECCAELEGLLGDELLGVVLFGSWARDEGGGGSDVDLMVVLRSLRGFDVRASIYRTLSSCIGRALTLVDVRASEVLGDVVELTPLLLNILVDGVVIYDKTGRLLQLVSRAREFVRVVGLVRYRTPDGRYGWRRADGRPLEPVRWP
jgi:predicted nucleotidyltransferase